MAEETQSPEQNLATAYEGGDNNNEQASTTSDDKNSPDIDEQTASQGEGDNQSDKQSDDTSSTDEDDAKEGKDDEGSDEENLAYSVDDLAIPEGMELDTRLAEKALPILTENKVPKDVAQKLVDAVSESQSELAKEIADNHNKMVEQWRADTEKQFGGENFEERLATAKAAIDKFMPPEQKEIINTWGIGNMPGFFAMAEALGNAMKEDNSFTSNTGNAAQERTVGQIWYG